MTSRRKRKEVREPIQVYLTPEERGTLDKVSELLGVSRAETLRRGIDAVARDSYIREKDPLDELIGFIDDPKAPADLAERHDHYLAQSLEDEWRGPGNQSS